MSNRSIRNVAVGSAAAAVLFGIPGGPAVGGGLAGYLEGERLRTGALAGVAVGVLSTVAIALFYTFVFQAILAPGLDPRVMPGRLGVELLIGLFAYGLVLGVGGGLLGSYLNTANPAD